MAPIKQWVNLDPSDPKFETLRDVPGEGKIPKERCGQVIKLTAKINRKKEGKRVFWGVELGPDNVEKNPTLKAGWAKRTMKAGFGAKGFYEKLAPTDEKGMSKAEFELSHCGGDEFTVKAFTKTAKGKIKKELKSEKYVVWRQLYYQVTRMGPSVGKVNLPAIPDIPWDDVKKEYDDTRKPHNIRWSEVPPTNPVLTRRRALWNEQLQKKTGVEGYDRAKEPLVVKVSIVDMLSERSQYDHDFKVVRNQKSYPYTHTRLLFDMNSVDDRDDWYAGSSATGIKIGRSDFTKTGPSSIVCQPADLPGLCKGEVAVQVQLYVFTGSTAGFSWYNGVWVSQHRPTATAIALRPDPQKVALMVHELGHAIGMVAFGVPTTDPSYPNGHPHYYPTSHGHQGPHCWKGAQDPATPGFGAADDFPSPGTCTMFGSLSSGTEKFCDDCSPFVRSRKPSGDGNFKASRMLPTTW